jgi:putative ABC transport system substrate-binding protein
MRRREFISVIGGVAAAWPLMARAQQSASMRRVGVLFYTGTRRPSLDQWLAALRQGLEQLGWSEGRDLQIDVSYGDFEQLRQSAQDLVARKPNVLLATSTPSLNALRPATSTIPIVFTLVTDPVGQGFVTSLARPAGNITGFMNFESGMGGKWVEMLLEISPNLAGIAVISNSKRNPQTEYFIPSIEAAIKERSLRSLVTRVQNDAEFDRAVAALQSETRIGMVVPPGPITNKIVDAMADLRMPAIYWSRVYADAGGLVAYGTNEPDLFLRAAGYVDRILKGALPSELPVQTPTKFELVINLKAARDLGITVPPTLLARADDVIE